MAMNMGAWHLDPVGRNRQRYHDGKSWTDHVIRHDGAQALDPLLATPSTVAWPAPPSQAGPAPVQPPAPVMAAALPATGSRGSFQLTKPAIFAFIATIGSLFGCLSMNWATVKGDLYGTGATHTVSLDRSMLVKGLDTGGRLGALWEAFVRFGWVIAPMSGALAAALALGFISNSRRWTIISSAIATAWAVGTAQSLSATDTGGTISPAFGIYFVAGTTLVALVVAVVAGRNRGAEAQA